MRNRRFHLLFAVVVYSFVSYPAFAQEQAGTFYLLGGIAFPHQEGVSGETHVTYLTAPGGTTTGWTGGAGVFVGTVLSIEGELLNTGVMTAREPSRYDTTYTSERRDRFLSGNVRFHLSPRSPVHLEPVVGFCLIRHEGWTTVERQLFFPQPHIVIDPRSEEDLPDSLGLTAGADLRIGGRHFSVLPSFRFIRRLTATSSEGNFALESHYPGGFPNVTLSGGLLARIDF